MLKITKLGRLHLKPTDYKFLKVRVGNLITVKLKDNQINLTDFDINAPIKNQILIQKPFFLSPLILKLGGFNIGDKFKIIEDNFTRLTIEKIV